MEYISGLFGYLLWFLFDAVSNYGIAIMLFAIIINLLMLPMTIKNHKAQIKNSKMMAKQAEIRKRYEKDKKKQQEEMMKLYEKDGSNPLGCSMMFTMILQFVLWGIIMAAVRQPLQNTLHLPIEKVTAAVEVIKKYPEIKLQTGEEQLQIVRHFDKLKPKLTMFNKEEMSDLEEYSHGFDFFGITLLKTPRESSFNEGLWLIPVASILVGFLAAFIMRKRNAQQQTAQGCMKYSMYIFPIIPAIFAFNWLGAVGVYITFSSFLTALQNYVLYIIYNEQTVNAKDEAAHYALMKLEEEE